jgi:serine/threonine-protein kinase
MEYLQGEALDARFERLGALPWPQAVSIARAVLSGLAAVHSAQIVHRDVKPSNVMLLPGPPEVAKLIDFGVARSTKLDATRYTRSGAVLGTPAFMSPEQLLGKPIDARTDVYSVALMLYELISGALPYGGEDMAGVLRRAMGEVPAFEAAAGRPVVPPLLREAILIALEVDPAERPQNAAAFSNMLASAHERSPNHPALVATHVADAVPVGSARPARFLIAARLPPSRLVISAERRWLSEQVQAYGRGFVLGAQHWFALLQVPGRERDERAAVLEAALKTRYGDAAAVATRAVDDELVLSAAALSGAEPLPQPLIELLATL